MEAKVAGLDCLVALLGDRTLDFVLLCSSINAVGGVAGTYAYTAANAFLDAFAISKRRPAGWSTLSIAWDAWREVGMATKVVVPAAMRAARAAYVAAGIPPRDGAAAVGRALASGLPLHVVSPYDVERLLEGRRRAHVHPDREASTNPAPEEAGSVPSERVRSSSHAAPEGDIEERLVSVWEDLLGVTTVGVHDNFFELGGHSLLATRVLARIDGFFGVRLPLRAVFEAPTIRQLGELIAAEALATTAEAAAPAGEREEFEL